MHVKTVILRHDKNRNCQYCCVDLRMQLVETQSINEMDSSTPQLQSNTFPLFDSRTMRLSACAHCGRVIMKQAERKSTFTLWSLSWDICPLSSCYMSGFGQDRLQGHFLSVPSPISFPPYLNKSSFPGISTQPLVIWCRDQTCMQADSLGFQLVCIHGTEHFNWWHLRCLKKSSKQSENNFDVTQPKSELPQKMKYKLY